MIDVAHSYNMRIQFDTHQCHLAAPVVEKILAGLPALGEQVKNFPVSDLHILIARNNRTNDYSVKTSLILPGETLVSSDHDVAVHAAFERCVNNLIESVRAYKDRLGNLEERQKQEKRTRQDLQPDRTPDLSALDDAVASEDYGQFRTAAYAYEEPVRMRVGRRVERYPEVNAQIGRTLTIADLVEEVFLQAFDGYAHRPKDVRFGEWLESLIDLAIKTLQRKGDVELENINRARSAVEAVEGRGAI
jgi:ribosome-associated translation inhibitor RaiA